MALFRSKETEDLYEAQKQNGHLDGACVLCSALPLQEFTHWKLINNKFPYDRICKVHHMVVPKRHIIEMELTGEEKSELLELKHTVLNDGYTFIVEPLPQHKSIPTHFHLHLLIPKDDL